MRALAAVVSLILIAVILAGCETVKGVGRDIVNTSDGVQRLMTRQE